MSYALIHFLSDGLVFFDGWFSLLETCMTKAAEIKGACVSPSVKERLF